MSTFNGRIAEFENLFLPFAVSLPPTSTLRHRLAPLCKDLCEILASLETPGFDPIDRLAEWCERLSAIRDPAFDDQLEELLLALQS